MLLERQVPSLPGSWSSLEPRSCSQVGCRRRNVPPHLLMNVNLALHKQIQECHQVVRLEPCLYERGRSLRASHSLHYINYYYHGRSTGGALSDVSDRIAILVATPRGWRAGPSGQLLEACWRLRVRGWRWGPAGFSLHCGT
jgi:hypothetical protein